MLLVDIDNFKKYNDRYGHQAGDDCICQIGNLLAETLKYSNGQVARYGGEEFAVTLPDVGLGGAVDTAKRILKDISELAIPHPLPSGPKHVSVSIGVARANKSMGSFSDLIATADAALYDAKHKGRNRLAVL